MIAVYIVAESAPIAKASESADGIKIDGLCVVIPFMKNNVLNVLKIEKQNDQAINSKLRLFILFQHIRVHNLLVYLQFRM